MQPARFKLHAEERTCTPSRDLTLGVMHLPWLELECTNPGSPRGQPGAREQEN